MVSYNLLKYFVNNTNITFIFTTKIVNMTFLDDFVLIKELGFYRSDDPLNKFSRNISFVLYKVELSLKYPWSCTGTYPYDSTEKNVK